MAAGGAGSAGGSVESSLDRRLQSVTSTTESIQGFSAWCIESKKYHSLIVRHWIKWLRKSDAAHRLNLFYLANDIIQNCKRKNAIVYRTAFAEVLPDAFLLVNSDGDFKVMKQVERILSIWEERNIYSGSLISELRGYLDKEESPPETPVEQKTPVDSKAALRSKIVSEFVPQALIDQLSNYKKSVEEVELREKQLAAMRVDVCSTEALKKLKDKAGGKRFSTDFEDGSAKLQEFVKFFDQQSKGGSLLLEALSNADIFYEMQYKEVKIVAHAYQTFANRVSHLKRKLDSLKANLPDLDESPIPSPSADAPSPTGSESPFRGLELSNPDPDLDGSAMDDEAEPPAPSPLSSPGRSPVQVFTVGENDNREVEDMELSEEEMESGGIIVEQVEQPAPRNAAASVSERLQPPLTPEVSPAAQATPSAAAKATPSAVAQATPSAVALPAGLANVDLSKIGTLLNSLTSVIKNTGPAAESPPTPVVPISAVPTNPPASVAPKDSNSLVNLLSQVDMTPEGLLGALSKAQRQSNSLEGLGSLLNNPVGKVSPDSSSKGKPPIPPSSALASTPQPKSDLLSSLPPVPSQPVSIVKRSPSPQSEASALVQALHRDMELTTEPESSVPSDSLESKIHNFLQGNPGFNAFNLGFTDPAARGNNLSPLAGSDTRDGTPVRDEGGGTPTQDEIMDKPAVGPLPSKTPKSAVKMPIKATDGPPLDVHQNKTWHAPNHPHHSHLKTGEPQNGQGYQPYLRGAPETAGPGITTPVVHHQQIVEQTAGPLSRERLQGNASGSQTVEGFQGDGSGGWYGSSYPEPGPVHHRGHSEAAPGGDAGNQAPTLYPYQRDLNQEPRGMAPQQGVTSSSGFYNSSLPPVPKLPPPPEGFAAPSSVVTGEMVPQEQHSGHNQEMVGVTGARVDSVMSGMVVHDHQHKSMFHHEDPLYNHDDPYHHHEELPPPAEDLHYQEELCHYQEDPQYRDPPFHQDNSLRHQEDPYFPPADPPSLPTGSPHRYPRVRGGLTPPVSAYGLYPHGSSPPHLGQRRAPPPHPEMMRHAGPPRHPGPRPPPIRPVHPLHHHLARGPRGPRPRPPFPPFHGPNPWLRGPGPRGGGPGGPGFPPKRPYLPPRY